MMEPWIKKVLGGSGLGFGASGIGYSVRGIACRFFFVRHISSWLDCSCIRLPGLELHGDD